MMAAAQKMIQERKAQLNTVAVCMHVVQGGLKSIHWDFFSVFSAFAWIFLAKFYQLI